MCNILGCIGVLLSKGIGIVIGSVLTGNINYIFDFMSWFVVLGVVGGAVGVVRPTVAVALGSVADPREVGPLFVVLRGWAAP